MVIVLLIVSQAHAGSTSVEPVRAAVDGAFAVPDVSGDFDLRLGIDPEGVRVSGLTDAAGRSRPQLAPSQGDDAWSRYGRAAASVATELRACRAASGLDLLSYIRKERYWISAEGRAREVIGNPSGAEQALQVCLDAAFSHATLQPDPHSTGWVVISFPLMSDPF